MKHIGILFCFVITACVPARLAVYSRPGGAEVYLDDVLVARTVNEATPVRIETSVGKHNVRIVREGYHLWEREVEVRAGKETPILADLVLIPAGPPHIPVGSLELRTDQGGVRILIDGEEVGFSRSDPGRPVIIENLAPGRYILRFERPGYEPIEERYEVFAGQTTRAAVRLSSLTPYFIYPSNDDLLRQTALRVVRGIPFLPGMRSSKSIALVNLEGDVDELNSLRPLLEDVLIAELVTNGRAVAERDDHLLVRLAHEAARGDSLVFEIMTRHGGRAAPFLYDARLQSSANAIAILTDEGRKIIVEDRRSPPNAAMPTADQILGFKIVEKTLRVDPVDVAGAAEPMLRRQAIIRLFVRLLDAKTGIVEWAERFDATIVDQVPARVYRWLENPPSRAYAYGQRGDRDTFVPEPDVLERTDIRRLGDVDAMFWYFRHLGESYLRADRIDEAVYHLNEAVILRPTDYESRMLYGEALLKSGNIDAAGREYLQALRML